MLAVPVSLDQRTQLCRPRLGDCDARALDVQRLLRVLGNGILGYLLLEAIVGAIWLAEVGWDAALPWCLGAEGLVLG